MDRVFNLLKIVSKVLNLIAGIAVTLMMFLTVADVLLRAGGHPIIGTYEIVALSTGARHRLRHPPGLAGQRARLHGVPSGEAVPEGQERDEHVYTRTRA